MFHWQIILLEKIKNKTSQNYIVRIATELKITILLVAISKSQRYEVT